MSNDTPPRACLSDFGFVTIALNPGQESSCSAQQDGGTPRFMSPELLVPDLFGKKVSLPTPQADIYAFGLVIFQVCKLVYGYQPSLCIFSLGPYGSNPI